MTRCVIYSRVSSDDQADNGTSLDTQEARCLALAEAKGWEVVGVYREDYTGFEISRPELDKVRQRVRNDEVDVLLCFAVDRFTRHHLNGNILLAEMQDNDVQLVFEKDPIDLNHPAGGYVLQMFLMMAEGERNSFRERSMRGREAAFANGKFWMSCKDMYGYTRNVSKGVRIAIESEAAVVRDIYDWSEAGESLNHIARMLNERGVRPPGARYNPTSTGGWQRESVRRLLANEAYKGWTVAKRTQLVRKKGVTLQIARPPEEVVVSDTSGVVTPALVTAEQWERVNARISARKGDKTRQRAHPVLLRGRVYCGKCGRRMYTQRPKSYCYYICSKKYVEGHSTPCEGSGHVNARILDPYVWGIVEQVLENPERAVAELQRRALAGPDPKLSADRQAVVALIRQRDGEAAQLARDLRDPELSERSRARVKADLNTIEQELERAESRLTEINEHLQQQADALASAHRFEERLRHLGSVIHNLDLAGRIDAMIWLDVRVTVRDPRTFEVSMLVETDAGVNVVSPSTS